MILGVSAREVFLELPGTKGTTGRQLRAYLVRHGRVAHVETVYKGALPSLAIVGVRWPKRFGHWIVWNGERFFDPAVRDPSFAVCYGSIRSFIAIDP